MDNVSLTMDVKPLTTTQLLWLHHAGGRTEDDVRWDGNGKPFIELFTPYEVSKTERMYVPDKYPLVGGRNAWPHSRFLVRKREDIIPPKNITYDGQTLTISEWAQKLGVKVATLKTRIARGMPLEKVLSSQMYDNKKQK